MTVNMQLTRILVPTAGPVPAKMNADYIMNLARRLQAQVYAIHIRDIKEERESGLEALKIFEKTGSKWNVPVVTEMLVGKVVDNIIDIAERRKIDLIVMGGSQDRIVSDWIVTEVLKETRIPVVIIPFGLENLSLTEMDTVC